MAEKQTCEECGADLPVNAPQGLCPRCLVGMAMRLSPQDPATIRVQPENQAGDLIDRYKLLQKIGEGGMGVVYMAEQEEPIRGSHLRRISSFRPRFIDWGPRLEGDDDENED